MAPLLYLGSLSSYYIDIPREWLIDHSSTRLSPIDRALESSWSIGLHRLYHKLSLTKPIELTVIPSLLEKKLTWVFLKIKTEKISHILELDKVILIFTLRLKYYDQIVIKSGELHQLHLHQVSNEYSNILTMMCQSILLCVISAGSNHPQIPLIILLMYQLVYGDSYTVCLQISALLLTCAPRGLNLMLSETRFFLLELNRLVLEPIKLRDPREVEERGFILLPLVLLLLVLLLELRGGLLLCMNKTTLLSCTY